MNLGAGGTAPGLLVLPAVATAAPGDMQQPEHLLQLLDRSDLAVKGLRGGARHQCRSHSHAGRGHSHRPLAANTKHKGDDSWVGVLTQCICPSIYSSWVQREERWRRGGAGTGGRSASTHLSTAAGCSAKNSGEEQRWRRRLTCSVISAALEVEKAPLAMPSRIAAATSGLQSLSATAFASIPSRCSAAARLTRGSADGEVAAGGAGRAAADGRCPPNAEEEEEELRAGSAVAKAFFRGEGEGTR